MLQFNLYFKKIKTILFSLIMAILIPSDLYSQEKPDSSKFQTETIEVDILKSLERFTPVTFENITKKDIEKKYWMQDLPMFLNGYTSINSYSESGASLGYSYLSIRGFDQRRISISINGIPQNDPEDHQVYWNDISDITSSVENIEIQRGIGTALYGTSSIGGVVNVQTVDYFKRKLLNFSAGYGNYNSQRYSIEYSSGLLKNDFALYGKASRIKTDGYRDLSWSEYWSYFLSGGKLMGKNSVLKFNFYGSPMQNHLAYLGVDKAYLDGEVTGDIYKDRKYNYLTYEDETDNYYQPHFELVYNIQPSSKIYVSNTLSYIRGEGYFITSFPVYYGYDFDYFRLEPYYVQDSTSYNSLYYKRNPDGSIYYVKGKGYEIVRSDIFTRLNVDNNTYGWFPKVQIDHSDKRGNLVIGGELRLHNSDHYGQITSGDALPPGTPQDFEYYYYNGGKQTYSIYANEIYKFTDKFNGMLGLQYVYHNYDLSNNRFNSYNFSVDYNFFTPRIGVNYNFNKEFSAFANFSVSNREPRLKDIYNAEDPYAVPNFRIVDAENGIYEDPLVQPEEMMDYEAGISYKNDIVDADLNFYMMDFKNEIVKNGELDNVGQPITGNAGKSIHQGMELQFNIKPFYKKELSNISVSGNLNLSDNYFTDYTEVNGVDSLGNIIYGNDYSDNSIILTPDIIANVSLNYFTSDKLNAYFSLQYIGKQYLDNSENERKNPDAVNQPGYTDKVINPYTVFNAGISYNFAELLNSRNIFKNLELNFKANNIFNVLYETTGNVSEGVPYWIPGATGNFYLGLNIGF